MSWRSFFHRAHRDAELAKDIQFYLDAETDENVARGMPADIARDHARRKFGNATLIREEIYRMNRPQFFEALCQDGLYALRMMRRKPMFTAMVTATLALGIGANTAIFSVVNTVLLKPARFADPERTVWLATTTPNGPDYGGSDPKFNLWREQTSVLEDVTGQAYAMLNLTGVNSPERVQSARVTSAYFRLLGLPISRGRGFTPEEDRPNGRHVVVLSDGF